MRVLAHTLLRIALSGRLGRGSLRLARGHFFAAAFALDGRGVLGMAAYQPLYRDTLLQRLHHQDDSFFLFDRQQQPGLVCLSFYLLSLCRVHRLWPGAQS